MWMPASVKASAASAPKVAARYVRAWTRASREPLLARLRPLVGAGRLQVAGCAARRPARRGAGGGDALRARRRRAVVPLPRAPGDGGVAARRRRVAGSADARRRARPAGGGRRVLPGGGRGRAPAARAGDGAAPLDDAAARGHRVPRQRQGRRDAAAEDLPRRRHRRLLGGRVTEVANVFDVALARDEGDPPGYETPYARLGPLIGATALGASVYELARGQSVCPSHYEYGNEEWLIVLGGRPALREPGGE